MSLQIIQKQDRYKVIGDFGGADAASSYAHFIQALNLKELLKIDIDEVTQIDRTGVDVLTRLHEESLSLNSKLHIVGRGSRDIYEEIRKI